MPAVPIDVCWLAIPGLTGHVSPAAMVCWPKASPALNPHLHQSSVFPAGQPPSFGAIPLHVAALHDPAVHVRSLDFVYPASHTRLHTCPWLLLPVQDELIEACWLATPGLMAHVSPTVMLPCFKDCPPPYPHPCYPPLQSALHTNAAKSQAHTNAHRGIPPSLAWEMQEAAWWVRWWHETGSIQVEQQRGFQHKLQRGLVIPSHAGASHEPAVQVRSPDLVYPSLHNRVHI